MDDRIRVAHSEPDFSLLRWRGLFVTIFRGPLVTRHMEVARPIAYEAINDAVAGGALLTLFGAKAFEAGEQSRNVAVELFEDAGRVVRAVAVVYEATGAVGQALRERSRDILARSGSQAPFAAFEELPAAVKWVLETSKIGTAADVPTLVAAIERERTR